MNQPPELIAGNVSAAGALDCLVNRLSSTVVSANTVRPGDVILRGSVVFPVCKVLRDGDHLSYQDHLGRGTHKTFWGVGVSIVPREALFSITRLGYCVCGALLRVAEFEGAGGGQTETGGGR